jgi:hypothetical protein
MGAAMRGIAALLGSKNTKRVPGTDREACRKALERKRHAARQREEEEFTSLAHHISIAVLRTAFYAAPGVDRLTADLLRSRPLTEHHRSAFAGSSGAYRALPRCRHDIPKADGR